MEKTRGGEGVKAIHLTSVRKQRTQEEGPVAKVIFPSPRPPTLLTWAPSLVALLSMSSLLR